jgi:hypothetical protein
MRSKQEIKSFFNLMIEAAAYKLFRRLKVPKSIISNFQSHDQSSSTKMIMRTKVLKTLLATFDLLIVLLIS